MAVDPLFPYPEFPAPSDMPPGQIDRSKVRYPQGMFDRLPYRPYRPRQRTPVVQAQPPEAKTVAVTLCEDCDNRGVRSQMAWFEPGFWLCNRCGHRQKPK